MLILPELAVALRYELKEKLDRYFDDAVALSVWSKARPSRAAVYIAALQTALAHPLTIVLWPKGTWARGIEARDHIGGELVSDADLERVGQLWLFDSLTLPQAVRQRFTLPPNSRIVGRILLPIESPERGSGMGYLLRTPHPGLREDIPYLRLLPELYPGEFLADPHVNFIAARRYSDAQARDVTPATERARGGRVLSVPDAGCNILSDEPSKETR